MSSDHTIPPPDAKNRTDRLTLHDPGVRSYNPSYSKFVRRMRLFLPVLAVIIMTAVILWIRMGQEDFLVEPGPVDASSAVRNEVIAPHFQSVDEYNRPFSVTAREARQAPGQENLIILDAPQARMTLKNGTVLNVTAGAGRYEQDTRKLALRDHITVSSTDGYQIKTAALFLDLTGGQAQSAMPVQGHGPGGSTLSAQGLIARSGPDVLILNGPARVVMRDHALGPLLTAP